jgi:hypothetical protein
MLKSFRGTKAHDFEWLRTQYLQGGGSRFSREIVDAFTLVNSWSTDMRYLPGKQKTKEAEGFLAAAGTIIHWANRRL